MEGPNLGTCIIPVVPRPSGDVLAQAGMQLASCALRRKTVKGAPSLAVPRRFVMEPREYALYAVLYLLTRLVYVLLRKGWPAEERR